MRSGRERRAFDRASFLGAASPALCEPALVIGATLVDGEALYGVRQFPICRLSTANSEVTVDVEAIRCQTRDTRLEVIADSITPARLHSHST